MFASAVSQDLLEHWLDKLRFTLDKSQEALGETESLLVKTAFSETDWTASR